MVGFADLSGIEDPIKTYNSSTFLEMWTAAMLRARRLEWACILTITRAMWKPAEIRS